MWYGYFLIELRGTMVDNLNNEQLILLTSVLPNALPELADTSLKNTYPHYALQARTRKDKKAVIVEARWNSKPSVAMVANSLAKELGASGASALKINHGQLVSTLTQNLAITFFGTRDNREESRLEALAYIGAHLSEWE